MKSANCDPILIISLMNAVILSSYLPSLEFGHIRPDNPESNHTTGSTESLGMMFYTLLVCVALTLVRGETTPSPPQAEVFPIETEFPVGEIPENEPPEVEIPEGEEPGVEFPEIELPEIEIPEGEEPEIELPEVELPEGLEPEGESESEGEEGIEIDELSSLDKLLLSLLLSVVDRPGPPAWGQQRFPCRFPNAPGCNPSGQGEGRIGRPGKGNGQGRPPWLGGGSGLPNGPVDEQ